MKILYLEDDPRDAYLAQRILTSAAPQIALEIVHTIKDAIHILDFPPHAFDLVLTDLNLPDGNGLNLLNHIRSRGIPVAVVVVTGRSDETTVVAALKAGADDYVVKREDYLERLPVTLENALTRFRAESALHSRSLRVLYAENNEADADLTRRHMERYAGHILLDIVTTPEEVRLRLNRPDLRDAYDVLLLDYMLPGLNALELLKEINEQYSLRVPVILVTGYGSEDIAIQATRMGAADYVVKTAGYLFKLPVVIENAYHRIELAREQAALRTAESRYRDLVEKNPGVLYIDTPTLPTSTLFISKQIQAISGFTSGEWTQDPDLWRSLVHPEDREAYLALEAACDESGQPFRMEYRLVRRDGEIIWLRDEAVLMLDADGNRLYWQGLLLDITAERQAAEAIKRRDAILGALSLAAENMLKQPWEDCIQQVLQDLGQAANASRSYLYQVHIDPDAKVFSTLTHEWVAVGIASVIQSPDRTDFDMTERGLQRWVGELSARRPIFGVVSELAETERAVLEETDVLSLVVVPIFVRQKLWGLWGFDDCVTPRQWYGAEIEALRAAANILGAAIQRLQDERALQRQLNEMTVIQAVTAAGTESTSVDELLEKVTRTIGASLFNNNCGFLLLDESEPALRHHPSYQDGSEPPSSLANIPLGQGVTGRAFLTGTPQLVRDVRHDADYIARTPHVLSEICTPLKVGDHIVGVLNAESRDNRYTEEDLRLLTTIASQVSTAVEKIRLLESEHRRLQESETLRQAAAIISSSLDLDVVLETILSSVRRVVPHTSAAVLLIEQDGALRTFAAQGFADSEALVSQRYEIASPLLEEVRRQRQPLIAEDVTRDHLMADWGIDTSYIHGWIGIPLITRDEVIGYLTLDNETPGAYTTTHAVVAQMLAYQAAAAISNAQLFEETRRRLHELEIVNSLSIHLRSLQDVEAILSAVLDQLSLSLSLGDAAIWLYSREDDLLRLSAARGWFSQLPVTQRKPGEGMAGKIFQSEQIYRVTEFSREASSDQKIDHLQGRSGVGLPLRTSNEAIGVLVLSTDHPRQLTADETDLLTIIAELTSNAIHRAQLYRRTQEQLRRLTALRDVDLAISSSHILSVMLDTIIDRTIQQLQVDAASILLYDPLLQVLKFEAGSGFRSSEATATRLRIGEGHAGSAVLTREMVRVPSLGAALDGSRGWIREGFVSYYAVPLVAKGQIKGVLEVFTRAAFSPSAEWLEFLEAMAGQAAIAIDSAQLFDNLQRTNRDLELAYDTTLEGWGKAVELRDEETERHTERVTELTLQLAHRIGVKDEEMIHIRRGALLHDIGKMGVPDNILRKAGPLTDDEWVKMRRHVQHAYDLLSPISYLRKALTIPYCHHEKWDGTGYPRGLKGEEIPLFARIFAVVDVWDALRSDRPYRTSWEREKVRAYIKEQSGLHFDPAVVEIFIQMVDDEPID
jgi:PAS domain S-box-containing protein/putative nucleotidyltransferase with HDIG domain